MNQLQEAPMEDDSARWPRVRADAVPWIDTAQMVEVDRVMIEDLRIELIQMMENAGRNLAHLTMALFDPGSVTVFAGSGGNGGGGLVAARHLANMGVRVDVVPTWTDRLDLGSVPRHQLDILDRIGVPVSATPGESGIAIDAMIGYSLRGAPRAHAASLIEATARYRGVVALDVPSGLDASTGLVPGVAVDADATLTLAAPKIGLRDQAIVGRLFLADISVPPRVYGQWGTEMPAGLFRDGPIVEVV